MNDLSRRNFLSTTAAGLASLGALSATSPEAHGQLVWKTGDWKLADFHHLLRLPARIKQVYDVKQIADGLSLNSIRNSLNGLHFGFGIPQSEIKIVAGLHGPANLLNYDDFIWEKYQVGEWLKVTDPATGKPAARNPFFHSQAAGTAKDAPIDAKDSPYQDTSIEGLTARGVQFLSCHTATEEQARGLIRRNGWSKDPEEIVREMLAHTLPGVMVVASMVAAIALLQAEGRFTYITV